MQRRIAFSSIFVLSLALLIIAMPYMTKMATKSSANADPEVGMISYYKADLFDYESSKRSSNGNFLLGEDEFNNDAALFLFNQEDYYVNAADFGQTVVPRPSEHNSWIRAYKYKVAQGLVKNTLNEDGSVCLANNRVAVSGDQGVMLFKTSDNNTYKGSYSFPFENIGNGYLQYDSSKNHVNVTDEVGTDGLLKMERYDMTSNIGFMPFNKLNTSKGSDENGHYALSGSKNYYFGMKLELPFVMPKGGKVTTFNGSDEDMVFSFSGDDDMWVFVDGNLVLDLGGVHDAVSGTINFATGEVVTKGNHYDETSGKYNQTISSVIVSSETIKSLKVGRHTLQVYYLERGGSLSNCKITFRLQEDKTPEETDATEQEFIGPMPKPGVTTINPIPVDLGKPNTNESSTSSNSTDGVTSVKPTEIEMPVKPGEDVANDSSGASSDGEAPRVNGGVGDEEVVANGGGTYQQGESTGGPQQEKENVVASVDGNVDLSGDDFVGDVTANDKKNKRESKGVTLFDSDTPLGFLPQTGTISEVVYYVVGALLIVVALAMVVVAVRKKK